MGLPSQTPRTAALGRTFVRTHHRRGLPVKRILIVVGVVAAVLGLWYFTRSDNAPSQSDPLLPTTTSQNQAAPTHNTQASKQPAQENRHAQSTPSKSLLEHAAGGPIVINQGAAATQPTALPDTTRSLAEALRQTRTEEAARTAQDVAQQPGTASGSLSPDKSTDPANPAVQGRHSDALGKVRKAAQAKLDAGDPVAARSILNRALMQGGLGTAEAASLREAITTLNEDLLFSPRIVKGDPLTGSYTIVSGDRLSKLPGKLGLAIDWHLLARINNIADPNKIRLGQKIKIIRGPFHAVVHKHAYRLDIYTGPPENRGEWTFVRSFRVGLGTDGSTPTGQYAVKQHSKLVNPFWVNPRTGEKFDADNPDNPIGERWIGIEGLGADAVKTGYGIHGTIDPGSIGKQKSMGCIRMGNQDVDLVYGLLIEGISRVDIVE